MQKLKNLSLKQIILIIGVITGGTGTIVGIPAIVDMMDHQMDRIDVLIFLLCNKDQGCVNSAFSHVLNQKLFREALSGSHH